jgi:hypothetical protein
MPHHPEVARHCRLQVGRPAPRAPRPAPLVPRLSSRAPPWRARPHWARGPGPPRLRPMGRAGRLVRQYLGTASSTASSGFTRSSTAVRRSPCKILEDAPLDRYARKNNFKWVSSWPSELLAHRVASCARLASRDVEDTWSLELALLSVHISTAAPQKPGQAQAASKRQMHPLEIERDHSLTQHFDLETPALLDRARDSDHRMP